MLGHHYRVIGSVELEGVFARIPPRRTASPKETDNQQNMPALQKQTVAGGKFAAGKGVPLKTLPFVLADRPNASYEGPPPSIKKEDPLKPSFTLLCAA